MEQAPGWNKEILEWCLKEAKKRRFKEEDYWGGFVIDEMKIQVRNKIMNFPKLKLVISTY